MSKRLLAAVAATLALALVGGIAYAASSDDGTIKACAKSENGQLRLDGGTGCLPSETAVQWSQAGPQGIPGPPGPAGITSAAERFFYRGGTDVGNWLPIVSGTWPDIRPHMTHVLTMHLDRGRYVVTAEIIAKNDGGQGIVVCLLGNPTVGYALTQSAVGLAPGFALQQTLEAQTIFPMDAPGDLELACFNAPPNEPAGNPRIGLADVIATKVDSSTVSQEP
jgi:hypothetical protein